MAALARSVRPDARKRVQHPSRVTPRFVETPPTPSPKATLGNQTLQRLLTTGALQAKLRISQPNDPYEQEADRVAEQVLRMPAPARQEEPPCAACVGGAGPCPKCAARKGLVQRRAADGSHGTGGGAPDSVVTSLGPGRPLDPSTRAFFEPRFGEDFSRVRVHADAHAAESARSVQALAYTYGHDLVFDAGQYAPQSSVGRRLLAHELTHVVQQGSGAAAHIQRTDWGILGGTCCNRSPDGDEWALVGGGVWQRLSSGRCTGSTTDCDGMTCGGGFYYVSNLETGSCRTPRRDDATFRPRRWTPERPRPDARSPSARGSSAGDTPPGYAYDREPLLIEHSSGSTHEVPGLYQSESEFGASGVTSSLTAPAPGRRAGRPVTGGFADDLDVDTGFATGVDRAGAREVESLVRSAGARIDPRLIPAMQAVAADRFVFRALRTFLETDNGRLVAWDNGSGRYEGDSLPPTINVGIAGGALDTRTTLVHELLHYVFDRADTVLGEAIDVGGADHPAIEAIESRFLIIDLIRSGQPPLHEKIRSSFRQFLRGRDFFPAMEAAIAANDRAALRAAVNDPEFVRTTVSSGLLSEASSRALPPAADDYRYTADQFRDLAFIWAQNAVIVQRAMLTAVDISTRTGTPLRDVFGRADWRSAMDSFLSRLVAGLRRDRRRGVVPVAAGL